MSGGRVELGLGAGWFDEEHQAFGIPFPASIGERFDRLEEQLEIVTGIVGHARRRAVLLHGRPLPARRQPWAAQAGADRRRPPDHRRRKRRPDGHRPWRPASPTSATSPFASVEQCAADLSPSSTQLASASAEIPSSVRRSAALVVCAGRDEEEIARRVRPRSGARSTSSARTAPPERQPRSPKRLRSYGATGATRIYLQILDLADLDHLRFIAEEVTPLLEA